MASDMEFEDLHDFVVLEVFKYLSIGERLIYCVVNKRWAQLLSSLWLKQRKLSPTSHRESRAKLLWLCPNLRELDTDSMFLEGRGKDMTRVGQQLAQSCPRIESIHIFDKNWLKVILAYVRGVDEVRLKRIRVSWDMKEVTEHTDRFEDLLKRSPLLEDLSLGSQGLPALSLDFCLMERLRQVLPKIRSLAAYIERQPTLDVLQSLSQLCPNLEKLDLSGSDIEDDEVLSIATNFKRLKAVSVTTENFKSIRHLSLMKDLVSVDYTSYVQDNTGDGQLLPNIDRDIEHFMSFKGNALKSFVFQGDAYSPHLLHLITDFCPNLETLNLTLERKDDLHSILEKRLVASFHRISKLAKLRRLWFSCDVYSGQGLAEILEGCPKLKDIQCFPTLSEADGYRIVHNLIDYSQKHPKRPICFSMRVKSVDLSMDFTFDFKVLVLDNLRLEIQAVSST